MNNEEKILAILETVQADISGLKVDVSGLKGDVSDLKGDVSDLKGDVSDLKADMSDVKGRLVRVELTQENVILPQLQLLAEGIATIDKKLIPRSEIDEMKEDISLLKSVVRSLSQELAELKKAQ